MMIYPTGLGWGLYLSQQADAGYDYATGASTAMGQGFFDYAKPYVIWAGAAMVLLCVAAAAFLKQFLKEALLSPTERARRRPIESQSGSLLGRLDDLVETARLGEPLPSCAGQLEAASSSSRLTRCSPEPVARTGEPDPPTVQQG